MTSMLGGHSRRVGDRRLRPLNGEHSFTAEHWKDRKPCLDRCGPAVVDGDAGAGQCLGSGFPERQLLHKDVDLRRKVAHGLSTTSRAPRLERKATAGAARHRHEPLGAGQELGCSGCVTTTREDISHNLHRILRSAASSSHDWLHQPMCSRQTCLHVTLRGCSVFYPGLAFHGAVIEVAGSCLISAL